MSGKNLFGSLVEKENMFKASTIVEDLAAKVPSRNPFYCTSPTMSWMSATGFVPGTMELIYGPKSSGKTMIALDRIKHMLAADPEGVIIYVDAEMGFEFESTIKWMKSNGVDTERVMIMREVNVKTIFEKKILGEVAGAINKDGVKLMGIVFDSIQAMATLDDNDGKKASKGELTKQDYGGRANYLARIFPFYRQFCRNYRVYSVFIGQARAGGEDMFGNPIWTTNGGEALYHEMQYRFLIQRAGGKDDIYAETFDAKGEQVKIGHRIKFLCEKNKMAEGLEREGFSDIIYMRGIVNVEEEIIDLAGNLGLVQSAGAWFEYEGTKYNGKKQLGELLRSNPGEYHKLFGRIMMDAANSQKYGMGSKLR
jgi:recombination protein RecA